MRYPAGRPDTAATRREAASWAAKMRGPDAGRVRLAFERWRAASPLNRKVYDEMEAISRGTVQLGRRSTAGQYFADRARRIRFVRPGLGLIAAAAAVTLLAGSAAVILLRGKQSLPAIASAATLRTPVGQIRGMRLADGTSVVLDADSEIVPAFDSATRLVRLTRGRARFDVARDAARPFVVAAGKRMILDRGTVFDVAIGRDGVKVTLLRGAIEIHDRRDGPGGNVGGLRARLAPGQAYADQPGMTGRSVVAASDGADRWTSGVLSYDGTPLADVVADLDRYSARKVRLGDPALGSLRVTGVFKAVPIDDVAAALAAGLRLHVVTAANDDLILQH